MEQSGFRPEDENNDQGRATDGKSSLAVWDEWLRGCTDTRPGARIPLPLSVIAETDETTSATGPPDIDACDTRAITP
jgi:hypothetical protein